MIKNKIYFGDLKGRNVVVKTILDGRNSVHSKILKYYSFFLIDFGGAFIKDYHEESLYPYAYSVKK